jgi:hypothetical protein
VFDSGVERSTVAGGEFSSLGNSLQWNADGTELYAATGVGNDSPYYSAGNVTISTMPVTSSGVGAVTTYDSTFREEGVHLHSDPTTGYVYDDWGEVVNSANGIPIGNYAWNRPSGTFFPGPLAVIDPTLQLFYILLEITGPDGSLAFQIQEFDQTNFQLLGTIVIPNATGNPTNFIRWGQSGLAFVTNTYSSNSPAGQLYILDGSFVNP